MIIFLLLVLFTIYFLNKYKEHFIIYIPIFTLAVDILQIFVNDFSVDAENTLTVLLNYFRVLIFILVILIILKKYSLPKYRFGLSSLFVFLIIKPIFTADPYTSIKTSISVVSYIGLFPAAYIYSRENDFIKKIHGIIRITLFMYLLNTVVFSFLTIGKHYYGSEIILQGSVPLFSAYGIMYSILFLFIYSNRFRKMDWFLILSNLVILVLLSKRTPVLLLGVGLIITFYKNRKEYLTNKYFGYTVFFILFGGIVFYLSFQNTVERRTKYAELVITEEGRYFEYVIIYKEILESGDLIIAFFGKDLFVEKEKFGLNQTLLDVTNRRIHSDYAMLLYGGGGVGFTLYMILFYRIYKKYSKLVKNIINSKHIISAFLAIGVCLFLNGFADSLTVSTARSIPYVYLGLLLGAVNCISARKRNETSSI